MVILSGFELISLGHFHALVAILTVPTVVLTYFAESRFDRKLAQNVVFKWFLRAWVVGFIAIVCFS